jgi:uncharacterized repeat protein (TIGR01451 family)
MELLKSSTFDVTVHDLDSSGTLTEGDELLYTVVATNHGSSDALGVVITDTPDPNTALVVGTTTTTQGTVLSGNVVGDSDVRVDVGTIVGGGGSVTVTFVVVIDSPLPSGVSEIANQAVMSGRNIVTIRSDDPDTVPGGDPTVDVLVQQMPTPVPDLSTFGIVLFTALMAVLGLAVLRR